jgi:hypothetical protein
MLRNLACLFIVAFMVVIFTNANGVKADIVLDGLISYWSLDQSTIKGKTVEDIVGENDGALNGNPKEAQGKIGEALEFNGENSVDITGTDSLNFSGEDAMTVVAWVNAGSDEPVIGVVAGCCGTIVAQRDANGWALRFDGRNGGQEMEYIVCPGWQGDGGFGVPTFPKGEWHYLAGVVDDDEQLLYVDGKLEVEAAYSGPMASNGPETEIGHAGDGGFIGIIDEVGIYGKALSEDEIRQNYESKTFAAVNQLNKLATCWGEIKVAR